MHGCLMVLNGYLDHAAFVIFSSSKTCHEWIILESRMMLRFEHFSRVATRWTRSVDTPKCFMLGQPESRDNLLIKVMNLKSTTKRLVTLWKRKQRARLLGFHF